VPPEGIRAETNSSPSSTVPARPKARESSAASISSIACALPFASNRTTWPRCGQVVPHSEPSGAIARSSTRTLLKWRKVRATGSNFSMPLLDDT